MSKYIVIGFVLLYYIAIFIQMRGIKIKTRDLCLCGIAVTMTIVLEAILIPLPTGATISLCSPVPLMLLALLVDYRLSIFAGWVCGLLVMFLIPGWQVVHWGQIFVEHMVCFSCLGFTGIFGKDKRWKIICGILLASCLKMIGHLLSGVLFFSQNAWDGWGAWGYSLAYNLSQNVPLCLISGIIVVSLPLNTLKKAIDRR